MSVKIIFGEEPYFIDKVVLQNKKGIKYPEMNLFSFNEYSDSIKNAIETFPVLEEKRLILLTLDELKNDDSLLKLIKTVPETTDFVIVAKELDKRTNIYKYAKNQKMLTECLKLTEPQLKTFIFKILAEHSARIMNEAYCQLSKRMNYFDDPEVNLYTVEIYIKQLCFLSKQITADEVAKVVPPASTEKAYALTNAILLGMHDRAFSLALDFIDRGENPIGLLSMMQRTLRLGYKASLYAEVDKKELGKLLGVPIFQFQDALHIPENTLSTLLDDIQEAINGIKNGKCEAEDLFLLTIGKMLSKLYPAELKKAAGNQ